jgi:hypothetical protein
MKRYQIGLLVAVVIAVLGITALLVQTPGELADFGGQGGSEPPLARDGAELERNQDGLWISGSVPTPEAGSYEYPTGDMVPPGGSHPDVVMGDEGEPEVFTMWAFVFNYPEKCTDGVCDFDDLGDTEAKGGSFQIAGRIADEPTMRFEGGVRLGQPAVNGSPLENPLGAEVHTAIAPHGKALTGNDLWAQLNGPVGNPTLWWVATFAHG